MTSETLFLQPTNTSPNPNPNFAQATGLAIFSNYNQSQGSLTVTLAQTLVSGGVATAMAEAVAIFNNDPTFSLLLTNSSGIGLDGPYAGTANSETNVVANFAVGANQTFSFDFLADLALRAKEIENPKTEYNEAKSQTAFVVLDTTDIYKPKVLDYFGIWGKLISSEQIGELKFGGSRNVDIASRTETTDVNGNNGEDFLTGRYVGTYQETFWHDTNITLVEINASAVAFLGDTLIGNLGTDVIYGTIKNDKLNGTNGADKMYGSLGNDRLDGKKGDDILEGGQGNDRLIGNLGNDKLYGGSGNDVLIGGRGSDILVGGDDHDQFVFKRDDSLNSDLDVIQDFQVGIDKIVLQNWGNINPDQWLTQMFTQGKITDTNDGTLFTFEDRRNKGTLLVAGVSSNLINSESIVFN